MVGDDPVVSNKPLAITSLKEHDSRTLAVVWNDGREDLYDVVDLRRKCPCALCIDEWTRRPRLKPEDISDKVRPINIFSIGNYALGIHFSDGHTTGIYTFKYLRSF